MNEMKHFPRRNETFEKKKKHFDLQNFSVHEILKL